MNKDFVTCVCHPNAVPTKADALNQLTAISVRCGRSILAGTLALHSSIVAVVGARL